MLLVADQDQAIFHRTEVLTYRRAGAARAAFADDRDPFRLALPPGLNRGFNDRGHPIFKPIPKIPGISWGMLAILAAVAMLRLVPFEFVPRRTPGLERVRGTY